MKEYVGGYDDWQQAVARSALPAEPAKPVEKSKTVDRPKASPAKKLSYKDQRELDQLPSRIELIETEIAALHRAMSDAAYFQQPGDRIAGDAAQLRQLEQDLAAAYQRWEQLM